MKGEFTQKGKEAMERFKVESANEVGVNLKQGYNGDLTARQAGSIGGITERFFSLPPRFAQHCPFFSVVSDRPCEQAESVP